jgi:ribonuclease Z
MSISYQVLGKPGRDNGLMVRINSGTRMYRLLFDCGENILANIKLRDIKSVDYLFLSHLHIDHIAGFDYFFRRNYDREGKPVYIFGPEDTVKIIHHRLRGYKWNLVDGVAGLWYVTGADENKLSTSLFKTSEGFAVRHRVKEKQIDGILIDNPDFTVKISIFNHIIPSAGYFVREKPSINIGKEALAATKLKPGPWLVKVRDLSLDASSMILIDDNSFKLKSLREILLQKTEGDSIGYLTDFIYGKEAVARVRDVFKGCGIIVCESQYLEADKLLAKRNHHLTSEQAAKLAKAAGAGKLILFHISDRYRIKEYQSLINEARRIFAETDLPAEWRIKY